MFALGNAVGDGSWTYWLIWAFGGTVGPGAMLALVFAATLARPSCPAAGDPPR